MNRPTPSARRQQPPPHGRHGACPPAARSRDHSGSESADSRLPGIPPPVPYRRRRHPVRNKPQCIRGHRTAAARPRMVRARTCAAAGRHCPPPCGSPAPRLPSLALRRMPVRGPKTHAPLAATSATMPGAGAAAPLCTAAPWPGVGGNAAQMPPAAGPRRLAKARPDMAPAHPRGMARRESPHWEICAGGGRAPAALKAIPAESPERERAAGPVSQHAEMECGRRGKNLGRRAGPGNFARNGPSGAPASRSGGAI